MYGRGYRQAGMGFGPPITPDVIKQLLIVNFVVFVAQQMRPEITEFLSVRPLMVWQKGFFWQPFTYMWLHGSLGHIAMNLLSLWMFGSPLAMAWGAKRFLRYYLVCGVGAGFLIASWPYLTYSLGISGPASLISITLGASGAIYGVLLAYSLTWPDRTIMLIFPPVAFRAIWLIPGLFVMTLLMDPGGNVSHVGHLGGVLVGWLYLRRSGHTDGVITIAQLKHRWRRYRMRQRLRAVRDDDFEARRRRDHDRTLH
ncbi:MAG: rhomboid family intramembrane serine protease [Candidatus Limnocylindria bacterium]